MELGVLAVGTYVLVLTTKPETTIVQRRRTYLVMYSQECYPGDVVDEQRLDCTTKGMDGKIKHYTKMERVQEMTEWLKQQYQPKQTREGQYITQQHATTGDIVDGKDLRMEGVHLQIELEVQRETNALVAKVDKHITEQLKFWVANICQRDIQESWEETKRRAADIRINKTFETTPKISTSHPDAPEGQESRHITMSRYCMYVPAKDLQEVLAIRKQLYHDTGILKIDKYNASIGQYYLPDILCSAVLTATQTQLRQIDPIYNETATVNARAIKRGFDSGNRHDKEDVERAFTRIMEQQEVKKQEEEEVCTKGAKKKGSMQGMMTTVVITCMAILVRIPVVLFLVIGAMGNDGEMEILWNNVDGVGANRSEKTRPQRRPYTNRISGGSSFRVKRGYIGPYEQESDGVIDEYEYGTLERLINVGNVTGSTERTCKSLHFNKA